MRAAIFSARATSTSATTTRAPSRANRSASARPIPCPPPVTTTHRPSSSIAHPVALDPEDLEHHTADLGEEVAGAALAPLREAELGARDAACSCACVGLLEVAGADGHGPDRGPVALQDLDLPALR